MLILLKTMFQIILYICGILIFAYFSIAIVISTIVLIKQKNFERKLIKEVFNKKLKK